MINHLWVLFWQEPCPNCIAKGLGTLSHLGDTQGQELRNSLCSHADEVFFPGMLKSGLLDPPSLLILAIVYIFLLVDNNLMCLETTPRAYVPLGNTLILLQMAWSLSFF